MSRLGLRYVTKFGVIPSQTGASHPAEHLDERRSLM